MHEFTVFDMIVIAITLILGLKGLFRGFIKEILGLIGIVGGIFVASRFSLEVGNFIAPFLALEKDVTIKLTGFVITLIGFWLMAYIIAIILDKVTDLSGLSSINRIFGFLFGSAKIFLIFSVIIYALYQIQSFKSFIDEKVNNSITFPYLINTGGYIVKLDTTKVSQNIQNSVNDVINKAQNSIKDDIKEKVDGKIGKDTSDSKDTKENSTKKEEKNSIKDK